MKIEYKFFVWEMQVRGRKLDKEEKPHKKGCVIMPATWWAAGAQSHREALGNGAKLRPRDEGAG